MAKASDNVFPRFLISEGGSTSTPASGRVTMYAKADGLLYSKDDAGTETLVSGGAGGGSVATDAIWDAAGDLVQGSGANTGAKLSAGTAGNFLRSAGAAAANTWAFPPGHEFNYVESTAGTLSVTATTEAGANTILTGGSVSYDGSTVVLIHAYSAVWSPVASNNTGIYLVLWDDTADVPLGIMAYSTSQNTVRAYAEVNGFRRLTPAAGARVYSLRAYADATGGQVFRGAGGTGDYMPAFIRITKAA